MAIDNSKIIEYIFLSKREYDSLSDAQKSRTRIFFIEDTGEMYKGKDLYNNSIVIIDGDQPLPDNPAESKIYIHGGQFKRFINGEWEIIQISSANTDVIDDDNLNKSVTAKAVKEYVQNLLKNYQSNDESIFKSMQDALDFANDTTKSKCGQIIAVMVNGKYIPYIITEHRELRVLTGSELDLDVETSSTVDLTISRTGTIKADVKISEQQGNTATAREDGIYVPAAKVPIEVIM